MRGRHLAQGRRAPVQVYPGICDLPTDRPNERTVGTSANNIVVEPTDPDLTALTPFPALMMHRAAQLGFRANGTKSSAPGNRC